MSSGQSNVVEAKERCPKCAAKGKDTRGDNLAIYSDGHKWCFACQYHEPSDHIKLLEAAISEKVKEKKETRVSLPATASKTIDHEGLNWLAKYGIMREEIIDNDIRWCPIRKALIFPIRDAMGRLLGYQRRNFDPSWKQKWLYCGEWNEHLHIIGSVKNSDKPIVIVEDIVSAIKVGRHARGLCIFGSHVRTSTILRVRWLTKLLIFWLDADKYLESIKQAKRAQIVNLPTHVIHTEKDPKEYSDDEILNLIYS